MANIIYCLINIVVYLIIQINARPNSIGFKESSSCDCGAESDTLKIVGGEEVKPYRYPWTALILKGSKMHCGGSLINDRYILTAAHCLLNFDIKEFKVFLGMHDLKELEKKKRLGIKPLSFIIHENYNSTPHSHDIGLIKLKKKIQPNAYHYICLPKRDEDYTDKMATTIGWGKKYEGGPSSQTLLEVNLTIISNKACKKDKGVGKVIIPTMLCTDGKYKDACHGDSGGPLMITKGVKKRFWEEIALVSFGHGCARPHAAGVFTRVYSFIDWIAEKTKDAVYCQHPK